MKESILNIILEQGYIAVLVFMFIENIFPPIPSEVILGFAGYLISQGYYDALGMDVVAICGSFLGAYIFYFIGYWLDENQLERFLQCRWVHFLGFSPQKIQKTKRIFIKHGRYIVLFGRFIPMIRSFISIPAGIYHMSFWRFSLYSLIGIICWNSLLIGVGVVLGEYWQNIIIYIKNYSYIILGLFILFILLNFIKNKNPHD